MKKMLLKTLLRTGIKRAVSFGLIMLVVSYVNAQTITDIDGNVYDVVEIAGLKWTKQNLKVTKYKNGDVITTGLSQADWNTTPGGAYAFPNGDVANVATYGLLYNAFAIRDARGIAPEGWRVATDDDWKALELFAGMPEDDLDILGNNSRGTIAGKLKAATYGAGATNSNAVGTDVYGFSVIPAGFREATAAGTYLNFFTPPNGANTDRAHFWTSTINPNNSGHNIRRMFTHANASIIRNGVSVREGNSIRLVQEGTTPVILKSFNIEKGNSSVTLSWSTSSETNSDFFEIEKSVDGKSYVSIAKIEAGGNSTSVLNYSFTDENPVNGTNYYRLRQTDKDGASSVYAVRAVNFGLSDSQKISVYPNPATEKIFLDMQGYKGTGLTVKILNINGATVHEETVSGQASSSAKYQLNITKPLTAGIYLVKISGANINETSKLLITK